MKNYLYERKKPVKNNLFVTRSCVELNYAYVEKRKEKKLKDFRTLFDLVNKKIVYNSFGLRLSTPTKYNKS